MDRKTRLPGRNRISYAKWGYIFIAPFFIAYICCTLIPQLMTFYNSLFMNYRDGLMQVGPKFVGLDNYVKLFSPDNTGNIGILKYFGNTMILWIMGAVPQFVIAMLLAVFFTSYRLNIRGQHFFKTVIYMPNLIMASAFSMLFFTLFSNIGPVNQILISAGWIDTAIDFFSMKITVRSLIATMNFLMWFGNTTILLMAGIYSCVPAYEKLSGEIETMRKAPEQSRAAEADDAAFDRWRSFRFEDVSFAYHDAEEETLRHVDFTIESGSVTALLGRNGSGKTTTVNLLLGFLQPAGGRITVDGVALSPENIRAWRRQVGYVPQDPIILNASVRENLLRFHPDATEEELIAALKTAMAWDFVRELPDGLDTTLGNRGLRLSGGERQRIVLARVLIGKPRLIILDEATSALDYESEGAFREVIRAMRRDIAVIVIAHRLATIRMADQAIVLEDGRIAEQGRIDELIRREKGYLSGMVGTE